MNNSLSGTLSLIALLLPGMLVAQESFFTHLKLHSPEKLVISSEWDSIVTQKDETSWEASLSVILPDSSVDWQSEITVRGKFRRARCAFPPLELNLKKRELKARGMEDFDKLKMVTHCNAESSDATDLYEEMLIYQLYNIITAYSFDIQLLKVDYLYPSGNAYRKNATALLLEPTSEITSRLGGQELEMYGVSEDSLNAESYCNNALFQFMIGNFDWDPGLQRNVKMIGHPGDYHVVPYDFDFSAIVFPSYGRMPAEFGLSDFRDRIYLGVFHTNHVPEAVARFRDKQAELLDFVANYDPLSKSRRKEIGQYLTRFFEFISDPALTLQKGVILPYAAK